MGRIGADHVVTVRCDRRFCRRPAVDITATNRGVWRVCDRHTPLRFHWPKAAYAVVLGTFAVLCVVAALVAAFWFGSPAAYIAIVAGFAAAVAGAWLLFQEDPF